MKKFTLSAFFFNKKVVFKAILLLSIACAGYRSGAQTITTYAGNGTGGYLGDGGQATVAELYLPYAVDVDGGGNLYVADNANNCIRKITSLGIISTIAGNGSFGFGGDGGPATLAALNEPEGVAVDGGGNVYIGDASNNRVRKVTPSGIISTIAGTGYPGYSGDGMAATAAEINNPVGIAVDGSGNVYIADQSNNRIRKVNPAGIISTIAGTGSGSFGGDGGAATLAQLNYPSDVAVDGSGNVYIADAANNRARKINPAGFISTIAGSSAGGYGGDGGPATAALMAYPAGICLDGSGNVYIADCNNSCIRKVSTAGIISTIAGTGSAGYSGDGTAATLAKLDYETGVAVDGSGDVYIADHVNNRIRKVTCRVPGIGSITGGAFSVCIGSTMSLSDTAAGGVWGSSTTSVATVGSGTGILTGIASGSVVVYYSN